MKSAVFVNTINIKLRTYTCYIVKRCLREGLNGKPAASMKST
ncbi:MAG: hypothetical protein JWO58_3201 [Chitinophagaceae bacterium]|nr:hypothetical protein [Chitinophagaceae bacterium]